nr:MAG TPA: hypothetical protein [Caudoviricetes sp.]
MKIDEILKLVNAGYTKEEIDKLDITEQKIDQKPEQKSESFDYDKFASALVKAKQIANGKTNFGGSNEKTDISKFF